MTISLWKKIISGSELREDRLHDEAGNIVPLSRLLRNGPRALCSGIVRLLLGYRVPRPWISYDAQNAIDMHLNRSSRVLEFGSGMSTAWYAKRAGYVLAIENYKPWFDRVRQQLEERGLKNANIELRQDKESYCAISMDDAKPGFDLIVIDGSWRDSCVEAALPYLRPGGILYIDNADRGPRGQDNTDGNMPRARELALIFAKETDSTVHTYVDFAPTQLFVQQGLLMRKFGSSS